MRYTEAGSSAVLVTVIGGRSVGFTSTLTDSTTSEPRDHGLHRYDVVYMSRRNSLKLNNERERQLKKVSGIAASSPKSNIPMSVVADAALAHLIQSKADICESRDKLSSRRYRSSTPMRLNRSTEQE